MNTKRKATCGLQAAMAPGERGILTRSCGERAALSPLETGPRTKFGSLLVSTGLNWIFTCICVQRKFYVFIDLFLFFADV